jgi:polar amino acid transport system substrate-binding protein
MKKLYVLATLLAVLALMLSACGGGGAADNLLDDIKQRGYLIVSTDANYEPQSIVNTEGTRPSDTKCPTDTLTTAEMKGFDIDVAHKIGDGLGVETCFVTPDWAVITAGSWADKWDLSVGSMTILAGRAEILTFTEPYYFSPAGVAVAVNAGVTALGDLSGQAICVGESTTYDAWAKDDYANPNAVPEDSVYIKVPANVTVVTQTTDQECAQAIAAGRKDFVGYATSLTVINSNIADGLPVVQLGDPIYSEELAAAVDKTASLNTDSFVAEVDRIILQLHGDGTLSTLSQQWFGEDLTKNPRK